MCIERWGEGRCACFCWGGAGRGGSCWRSGQGMGEGGRFWSRVQGRWGQRRGGERQAALGGTRQTAPRAWWPSVDQSEESLPPALRTCLREPARLEWWVQRWEGRASRRTQAFAEAHQSCWRPPILKWSAQANGYICKDKCHFVSKWDTSTKQLFLSLHTVCN